MKSEKKPPVKASQSKNIQLVVVKSGKNGPRKFGSTCCYAGPIVRTF